MHHSLSAIEALAARPEFTSRHNVGAGRHGWVRMTPAYSVHLVQTLLRSYELTSKICDPFGGSGTTVLCAAEQGYSAGSLEINPFLAWLAKAKVAKYTKEDLRETLEAGRNVSELVRKRSVAMAPVPPIHNVERWWSPRQLQHLRRLKTALATVKVGRPASDLLKVAFCRVIMETANVTRGHQSLSFADKQLGLSFGGDAFDRSLSLIVRTAPPNPRGRALTARGDARTMQGIETDSVDVIVTSPPYPNRITTVRELRPYLYWLGFFDSPTDGGELDWKAIGGTWGAATHRLKYWQPASESYVPSVIRSVCRSIAKEKTSSATILTNYVLRYFEDVYVHLEQVKRVVRTGGRLHYVIGNSSFYGNIVEAEKAYVDILNHLGFRNAEATALRKRSSKSELFEYLVTADK